MLRTAAAAASAGVYLDPQLIESLTPAVAQIEAVLGEVCIISYDAYLAWLSSCVLLCQQRFMFCPEWPSLSAPCSCAAASLLYEHDPWSMCLLWQSRTNSHKHMSAFCINELVLESSEGQN